MLKQVWLTDSWSIAVDLFAKHLMFFHLISILVWRGPFENLSNFFFLDQWRNNKISSSAPGMIFIMFGNICEMTIYANQLSASLANFGQRWKYLPSINYGDKQAIMVSCYIFFQPISRHENNKLKNQPSGWNLNVFAKSTEVTFSDQLNHMTWVPLKLVEIKFCFDWHDQELIYT